MSLKKLFKSLKDAVEGLGYVFKNEQNFRIQIIVAIITIVLTFYFPLTRPEILLVLSLIFAVLVMETLNTALENLADLLKPRLHHYVKNIKDIMAAAVLLTSLGAAVVGILIFLPHILDLFR